MDFEFVFGVVLEEVVVFGSVDFDVNCDCIGVVMLVGSIELMCLLIISCFVFDYICLMFFFDGNSFVGCND